jgi:hypothetical protein
MPAQISWPNLTAFSFSLALFAWFIPHFAKIFLGIITISWPGRGRNSLRLLHLIIQLD